MSEVCRSFGISRKTGYKLMKRYREEGPVALCDRSRRPVRYANQLPEQIERRIIAAKKEKPHWGARKIRELLVRRLAGDIRVPAVSTIHAVIDRHGLVKRRAPTAQQGKGHGAVAPALHPNAISGAPTSRANSRLGNRRYCYPAHRHRPCLALRMHDVRSPGINQGTETAFDRLPAALRANTACPAPSEPTTDCPSPRPNGLYNLSKLSVWWLRLGIDIERIKPGQPQQNGRHERMHLTLKKETTRPPGA